MDKSLFKNSNLVKRKQYLVQKPFQLKFALVVFLAMFTIILAVFFSVYLFNWKLINNFFLQREIYVNLYDIFRQANTALFIQLLILSVVLAAGSIFVSHKIAGPAYRLERNVRLLIRGDLRINSKLRKNDEFQSLADSIEKFTEKLNGEYKKERKLLQEIGSSFEILQNDLRSEKINPREAQAGFDKIKSQLEELRQSNNKIQLKD